MAKVLYKHGTKATYLGLPERLPNALYFCTDTHELFKGDDLYSDGLRLVESYANLPAFEEAADGILYFCKDSGCGYVLNESRDNWISVVYGVDNETIILNEQGLLSVKAVSVDKISGLGIATKEVVGFVKASDEVAVAEDGTMSLGQIAQVKIVGLEDRLNAIEKMMVGGVRYRGAVDTFNDLPAEAEQGDLYEVREDSSEWCFNGTEWFEYGKTTDHTIYATKDEVRAIAELVDYEIAYKPDSTIVKYSDSEIRVMCAADTDWKLQSSGENADKNLYYIGFKAYAPAGAVSFKEDLSEKISDQTMYFFEDNEFAGTDAYGRKYSVVWLPVAAYNEETSTWTYYGDMSTNEKYIGWYYSVEWYNTTGMKIKADTIRINLTNETCHTNILPSYVSEIQASLEDLEDSYTWGDM